MKRTTKTFIGGCVLGVIVGAIVGGFAVAVVMGTAFINYNLEGYKTPIIYQTK
jgi:hypothetical protein